MGKTGRGTHEFNQVMAAWTSLPHARKRSAARAAATRAGARKSSNISASVRAISVFKHARAEHHRRIVESFGVAVRLDELRDKLEANTGFFREGMASSASTFCPARIRFVR